jgi:hypothetical protein
MDLYAELAEYTGESYKDVLMQCGLAADMLAMEWKHKKSVLGFYRKSPWYIYDLTWYQTYLTSGGFYDMYEKSLGKAQGLKGLDLGGGIGEYTIHAKHCDMDFIEVKGSKTLDYAKWRFKKYGVKPRIRYEDFQLKDKYTFIIAMDVLEHLENPEERIKELADHTTYLFANPENVKYTERYPMHISHPDLTPYFEKLCPYLWRVK